MIYEIATLQIKSGSEAEFEKGVAEAALLFRRAEGCLGMALRRSIENPQSYCLVVQWRTVEDHIVGFRESSDFQAWRGLVAHCFEAAPRVEHMSEVTIAF